MGGTPPLHKGHRYPVEITAHCVWLYFRFPLSFREVEEPMLERGVIVSHETVLHLLSAGSHPGRVSDCVTTPTHSGGRARTAVGARST
ncbi:hypothetical protein GCM10017776_41090 [Streptomyces griseoluteus]|nr:hypothetical protein GCM10017776_41090 [Streptomyces griseoluteus]